MWSNERFHTLLVGEEISTITLKNSLHFVIKLELHILHNTSVFAFFCMCIVHQN